MKIFRVILLIFSILAGPLAANPVIKFENRPYNLFDIIAEVEKQSDLKIGFPFTDPGLTSRRPAQKLPLDEVLSLICRAYQSSNSVRLRYFQKGRDITFQKADKIVADARDHVLNSPLVLKGKAMSIKDAVDSASKQIGIPIDLMIDDPADKRMDYKIECTLLELLDEVVEYYRTYNMRYVNYALMHGKVEFFDLSRTRKGKLEVKLMPIAPKKKSKKLSELIPPKAPLPAKGKFKSEEKAFEKAFVEFIAHSPLPYFNREALHELLGELLRPRTREVVFGNLHARIQPYLNERSGTRVWRKKLLGLDRYHTSAYDKKKSVDQLIETWTFLVMEEIQKYPSLNRIKEDWSFRAHFMFQTGKDLLKIEPIYNPFSNRSSGTRIVTGFMAEHKFHRDELWRWNLKIGGEISHGISDMEPLDYNSVQFQLKGNRIVGLHGLLSISPYAALGYENNVLSGQDLQNHLTLIAGAVFHSFEIRNQFGFDKILGDTDLMLGMNNPSSEEGLDVYTGEGRNSFNVALRHRWTLIHEGPQSLWGPYGELILMRRSSSSRHEDANVYGFKLGFQHDADKYGAFTSYESTWWDRVQMQWTHKFDAGLNWRPFLKGERFFMAVELEKANDGEVFEDYFSKGMKFGVEYRW